jgi:hypothetical protein
MGKYRTHTILANEEVLTWAQDPLFDFFVLVQPSQVTVLRSTTSKIETQTWEVEPPQTDTRWTTKASCHRDHWAIAFFPTKKDVIQSEGSILIMEGRWGLRENIQRFRSYSIQEGYNIVGFLDAPDFWTIHTEKGPYRIDEDELPSFPESPFREFSGSWFNSDLKSLKSVLRGAEHSRLSRPLGGKTERWVWTQENGVLTLRKFDWFSGTLDLVQGFNLHEVQDEVLVDVHPYLPAAACWSPQGRHYIYSAAPSICCGYIPWPWSWCWTRFSIFVDHWQHVPLPGQAGERTWMDAWGRKIQLVTQASGPPTFLTEDAP